jgi:hypothetical protein
LSSTRRKRGHSISGYSFATSHFPARGGALRTTPPYLFASSFRGKQRKSCQAHKCMVFQFAAIHFSLASRD